VASPPLRRLGAPRGASGQHGRHRPAPALRPRPQPARLRRPDRRAGVQQRRAHRQLGILEQLDHVDPFAIPPAPKYFTQGYVGTNVTRSTRDENLIGGLPTNDLAWPSFLRDGTVIAGAFGNLLKGYGVWYFKPGGPDVRFWFGPTNRALRLGHPRSRAAATSSRSPPTATTRSPRTTRRRRPPARPAAGASRPRLLLDQPERHGLRADLVARRRHARLGRPDRGVDGALHVPAQTGAACAVTARHLIAGKATSPDWGPATG